MMSRGPVEHSPRNDRNVNKLFADIANRTSQAAGRAITFLIAIVVVLIWAVTRHWFQYSDTWQLVINTGTIIVTFLMMFLIQNSQNRDSAAIQLKLDELIRVSTPRNSLVGIERLTHEEIEEVRIKKRIARQLRESRERFRPTSAEKRQTGCGPRSWIAGDHCA
jgi:low affinity Fe/Cu permease